MILPDFLTEVGFGEIRVTGSRIGLYHIVKSYQDGFSIQQLAEEFPTLAPSLLQQVIDYYSSNKQEVDEYLSRCDRLSEEQKRGALQLDWNAMRKRLESLKGTDSQVEPSGASPRC